MMVRLFGARASRCAASRPAVRSHRFRHFLRRLTANFEIACRRRVSGRAQLFSQCAPQLSSRLSSPFSWRFFSFFFCRLLLCLRRFPGRLLRRLSRGPLLVEQFLDLRDDRLLDSPGQADVLLAQFPGRHSCPFRVRVVNTGKDIGRSGLRLGRRRFQQQHGTAANIGTAGAGKGFAQSPTDAAGKAKSIVVGELFPGINCPRRMDEYPVVAFNGLAIRLATMIDPARGVTRYACIDHRAVADLEYEGVIRIFRIGCRPFARDLHGRSGAPILDDAGAFSDQFGRKRATAVYAGRADGPG